MSSQGRIVVLIVALAMNALSASAASTTLAPGAKLQVRMTDRLSSDTAKPGDTFRGTLAQPVVVNGKTVYDKGTEVTGQVLQASKSGRLSSPGQLQLALTSISGGWFRSYPLTVQPLVIKGGSHTKSNIAKIGGGAAAGAIVGGVAAGGKGAAIGAAVGGGGGTAVAAATGKREVVVESEALLTWTTIDPNTAAVNANDRVAKQTNYRPGPDYGDRDRDDAGHAKRGRSRHDDDEDDDDDGHRRSDNRGGDYVFSAHDRMILRGCLDDNYSNLPPGLAKRDRLPPGLEKQLQRNGTLPPGLQKRVQPLPEACEVQLPRLPREWERVILGGRIILLDGTQTIRDILDLAGR